jgi:hypothetical protein
MINQLKKFFIQNSFSEQDLQHSEKILNLFTQQTEFKEKELIIDCHNYHTFDIYWILEFLIHNKIQQSKIIFITGADNHSKKPIMDYYNSIHWKNPLYVYIRDYFVKHNLGAILKCEYGKIIFYQPQIV